MSRANYGEGSVFFREATGLYYATYVEHGRRKRVSARTKRAALLKRKVALARISSGLTGSESRRTFAREAQRWVDVASRALNLTTASRANYVDVLRLHVVPVIGELRIEQVKPSHVSEVIVAMQDKGLSPSYRHQAHKAISHVFKMAIADGLVTSNPTRDVPAPRGTVKAKVVPDRDLVVRMIDEAADERLRTFLVLSAHTGLRISEVLALRWSDVNASTKSIAVRNGKGGKARAVYLTPTLAAQLKAWRTEQTRQRLAASWWSSEDWIITTEIGTQMDTHNWRRKHFNPLRDRLAPGVTPHSLRHAFATVMLEEGVPMRVVAEQLGHASTRVTEQTYSHVTARLQEEAGAAVERALGAR